MSGILLTGAIFLLGLAAVPAAAADDDWKLTPLSTTQKSEVGRIMLTIEERADNFERLFLQNLRTSTVPITERRKYRVWVDQVEDALDNVAEAYKEDDIAEVHEELRQAMEAARNINHFMLNAKWGDEAEATWKTLRDDLNALAQAYSAPQAMLIIVTPLPAAKPASN